MVSATKIEPGIPTPPTTTAEPALDVQVSPVRSASECDRFIMFQWEIFRHDPNSYFWVVPYISLAVGAIAIFFILRRIKSGKPGHQPLKPSMAGAAPSIDDPTLARYRDAIEKDTDRLE